MSRSPALLVRVREILTGVPTRYSSEDSLSIANDLSFTATSAHKNVWIVTCIYIASGLQHI